jgi:hypothetical protein
MLLCKNILHFTLEYVSLWQLNKTKQNYKKTIKHRETKMMNTLDSVSGHDSTTHTFNKNTNWKRFAAPLAVSGLAAFALAGCSDAQIASQNLSTAADAFEINRRVVFINGITDNLMLSIEGQCSIEVDSADNQLEVTCKTGPREFYKHFLGLADNVTYVVEQLDPAAVSQYQHRVVIKPQAFVPDFDFRGDAGELMQPTRP